MAKNLQNENYEESMKMELGTQKQAIKLLENYFGKIKKSIWTGTEEHKNIITKKCELYISDKNNNKKNLLGFLDKHYSIDLHIFFEEGQRITLQVKSRSDYFSTFGDITYGIYSNFEKKITGDHFKNNAEYYLYYFANKINNDYNITEFYLLNMPRFKKYIRDKNLVKHYVNKKIKYNEEYEEYI